MRDYGVGQGVVHGAQLPRAHRVLEAATVWTARPGRDPEEIAAHPQLLDRIVRQPGGVAAVGVVGAQPKDPLEQLDGLVSNLACLPRIVGRVWRSGALSAYFGDRDAMYAIDNRAGQGDPASGSSAG